MKARTVHIFEYYYRNLLSFRKHLKVDFIMLMYMGSNPTRGSSFFFGKVIALGVLCYFALLFV